MLRRRTVAAVCLVGLCLWSAMAHADAKASARAEVRFGIQMARQGLWREAIYRWERALALDPGYAAALNNLAVAYEHEGMLDKAKAAYERAAALGGNQPQIQQNYDLFQEIHERLTRTATP